jgi:hypothetical protein
VRFDALLTAAITLAVITCPAAAQAAQAFCQFDAWTSRRPTRPRIPLGMNPGRRPPRSDRGFRGFASLPVGSPGGPVEPDPVRRRRRRALTR